MIGGKNSSMPLPNFTKEEEAFRKDRFFENQLEFEDEPIIRTIVDCAEIVAIGIVADDRAGDSIVVTTKGGPIRLPCAGDDVYYTNADALEVYEYLTSKWVAYKLYEKK